MTIQPGAVLNTQSFGNRPEAVEVPRITTFSPTSSDVNYPIGKRWINSTANLGFELTSISTIGGIASATWTQTSTPGGALNTLTTEDSTVVVPSVGNINVVGSGTIQTTGSGSTVTISTTAGSFPISPYIVGPVGKAGYQTVQSAVTAANAAGGGAVYIQPGTYSENLTLFSGVDLIGAAGWGVNGFEVTITGVHTPPTSGKVVFNNINLTSSTHILSSTAAGTTTLCLLNCNLNCTSGYTFNLLNWTGTLEIFDTNNGGTTDGGINNTGGSTVLIFNSGLGNGTGNTMTLSGSVTVNNALIGCPVSLSSGSNVDSTYTEYLHTVTLSSNGTANFTCDQFLTGATPAITQSSTGTVTLAHCTINSSNNPVISGSGAGTVSLGTLDYVNGKNIASTLTVAYIAIISELTPFIVGPSGNYSTIQSAVTAAGAAGGGVVQIQNGTYTENLTLQPNVSLVGGDISNTIISGVHIPATSGNTTIRNLTLSSATSIFNSAAAGAGTILIDFCTLTVTNGYVFNLANWTAFLSINNCDSNGTNDGVINNTAGATVEFSDVNLGAGTGNTLTYAGGSINFEGIDLACPSTFGTGAVATFYWGTNISQTLTTTNNAQVTMSGTVFHTGSTSAISHGSSGTFNLSNSVINSSNTNAIAGSGAGIFTLNEVSFLNSSGIANTLTLATNITRGGNYITQFVVGTAPDAQYQTIQSAINAANTAGGGAVHIKPGTYTESLTLHAGVDLIGTGGWGVNAPEVTITGVHTPPASGNFVVNNINLTSTTSILSSAVAGTANLCIVNCNLNCTNGYTFNLLNWTGTLEIFDTNNGGTNDGGINNTGGATVLIFNSGIGNGTGNTMTLSGAATINNGLIGCPVSLVTGSNLTSSYTEYLHTLTASNNSISFFDFDNFSTGATAAITQSSTGTMSIASTVINSSNSPAITGTGAGVITFSNVNFLSNNNFANTLTFAAGQLRGNNAISRFIVGTAPDASYSTIQSAVTAAAAAGGGTVYIQPGSYTESLTLSSAVDLVGSNGWGVNGAEVTITGVHTPPTSGKVVFNNINLASTTSILSSASAGTATLCIVNCNLNCTSGYTFNLLNWTGTLEIFDTNNGGTTDGGINNTGGATVVIFNSGLGNGTGNTMTLSGSVTVNNALIGCPVSLVTGANLASSYSEYLHTLTASNNSISSFSHDFFSTGATAAITQSSTGTMSVGTSIITSSNNPAIAGTGAGTVSLGDITFTSNSAISGSLTTAWYTTKTGPATLTGNLTFGASGNKILTQVATTITAVANSFGSVTLGSGTATVSTTAVTSSSLIVTWRQSVGASTALGILTVGTIVNNTSFVISAATQATPGTPLAADASIVGWMIIN